MKVRFCVLSAHLCTCADERYWSALCRIITFLVLNINFSSVTISKILPLDKRAVQMPIVNALILKVLTLLLGME